MKKYSSLVKKAQELYNIPTVKTYKKTVRGFDNLNLILTTSEAQKFVLRRYIWPSTSTNHLRERVKLKLLLEKHNFPCRRILPDKNNKYFFPHKTRFNGLYSYIDAENPSIGRIRRYGGKLSSLIAELHKITKDFKLKYNVADWNKPTKEVLEVYNRVKKEEFWGMQKKEILDKLIELEKEIENLALPRGLIHSDVSESNILINRSGQVFLIDFDNIHTNILIKDLCFPLESAFADYSRWTPKLQSNLKKILGTYNKIRKLEKLEKENLFKIIRHNLLSNAVWLIYEWDRGRIKRRRALRYAKRRILSYLFMEKEENNFRRVFLNPGSAK